jgi:hypothetical protein
MLAPKIVHLMSLRKAAFEPQNFEQGMMNFEMHGCADVTSAVRSSLFDILNFKCF